MSNAIPLWPVNPVQEEQEPSITPFLLPGDAPRPAILVIPGGGYGCVCERTEGSPVAMAFNDLGFHTFVLHYRTAPHAFPAPMEDGLRAMRLIRGRAAEFHVIPDRIAACGFSAGGHLAGAIGIYPGEIPAAAGDEWDVVDPRPDAVILSYPVVSFEPWSHRGTARNFCGTEEPTPEMIARFSLDKRVDEKTPPVFLWHTLQDHAVDFHNSVRLAEALAKAGKPCELHLFPYGDHGMLLGLGTADLQSWPGLAAGFLETCFQSGKPDFMEKYTWKFQFREELRKAAERV